MKSLAPPSVKWLLLAGLTIVMVASLFGQKLIFASAVASSESRPALLRDAEWGKLSPSFKARFRSGTPETELQEWLEANHFVVRKNSATRRIERLPCNEQIAVTWSAAKGIIQESSAVVTEAGCL